MLVLSRKSNESIVIGDQIVVEILEISNNKIRIGIAAPASVRVVRGELTPKEPPVGRTPTTNPANASTEQGRGDGTARGRMVGRPLGRVRNNEARRSANPNVRTVADAARVRLRQLRQQLIQEGSGRDVRASQLTPPETCLLDPPCHDENPGCKLSGQEVAESTPKYQVDTTRPRLERRLEPSGRARIMEDRMTESEVYWQVKSLNQYQSDWVAEEPTWYEAIDAVPSVLVR